MGNVALNGPQKAVYSKRDERGKPASPREIFGGKKLLKEALSLPLHQWALVSVKLLGFHWEATNKCYK